MLDRQLYNIQTLINPEVIVSKGLNRNWSYQLRHGKHKYNKLGMLDYRVEQKVRKF